MLGLLHAGPQWEHVASTVLTKYVSNTLILMVSVTALSIVLAVPAAWCVSAFDFPGRRLFDWALILPLAIPTYVAAFVYYQVNESAIPLLIEIRKAWGVDAFLAAESIIRYSILSIALAAVLYPYLYLSARASFSQQRSQLIEAAQSLGRRPWSVFFTVALPLARPAIAAGTSLIVMEVVNDYGAVHFFGVPTLTEGIFRTWFGLGDRDSALRIASFVMLAVFAILLLEQFQRGRARFADPANRSRRMPPRQLTGWRAFAAIFTCSVPLAVGFLFPLLQLSAWALQSWQSVLQSEFLGHLFNSVLLAAITAAALTIIALLFAYTRKLHSAKWLRSLLRMTAFGYAAPGAVVAVGVLVTLGTTDQLLSKYSSVVLSGSLIAISFAYIVRFLTVSLQPVRAGVNQICGSLDEASRMLGHGKFYTLRRINLPLLKGTLWAAFTLVFVDILKELPLTIILRPANFETMATTAFSLAKEGRINECAVPSLILLLAGGVGLAIINRLLRPIRK